MYVLDTNTLIYFFKGSGNVAAQLLSLPPKDLAIPAVVLYELYVGIAKSNNPVKRKKQLDEMVSLITVVGFGDKEAHCAAQVRANLELKGTPIGPCDTLIAGTALAHQAILVTHNTEEFSRVNKLQLEDWF
ncbi:MAG: type II toxin-antitoxin system VapC family toxin [Psychrosphaera sp.]|nr:type II toxin-antitoxin system VapC family toxin [Psychrosphaera sp.]